MLHLPNHPQPETYQESDSTATNRHARPDPQHSQVLVFHETAIMLRRVHPRQLKSILFLKFILILKWMSTPPKATLTQRQMDSRDCNIPSPPPFNFVTGWGVGVGFINTDNKIFHFCCSTSTSSFLGPQHSRFAGTSVCPFFFFFFKEASKCSRDRKINRQWDGKKERKTVMAFSSSAETLEKGLMIYSPHAFFFFLR